MTGKTDRRFWKCFEKLPAPVQKLARDQYALWKRDPHHPSLHFEERRNRRSHRGTLSSAWFARARYHRVVLDRHSRRVQPFSALNPAFWEMFRLV